MDLNTTLGLNKRVEDMTDQELVDLVLQTRTSRRIPKGKRKVKTNNHIVKMASLSLEDLQRLKEEMDED